HRFARIRSGSRQVEHSRDPHATTAASVFAARPDPVPAADVVQPAEATHARIGHRHPATTVMSETRQPAAAERATMDPMLADFDHCYRAVGSRDARFDGWFFTAVTSTRIYCRPSCPAKTPKPENVRFYLTAAAAQQDGFRACLRCRPDAAPGSPEW